ARLQRPHDEVKVSIAPSRTASHPTATIAPTSRNGFAVVARAWGSRDGATRIAAITTRTAAAMSVVETRSSSHAAATGCRIRDRVLTVRRYRGRRSSTAALSRSDFGATVRRFAARSRAARIVRKDGGDLATASVVYPARP